MQVRQLLGWVYVVVDKDNNIINEGTQAQCEQFMLDKVPTMVSTERRLIKALRGQD